MSSGEGDRPPNESRIAGALTYPGSSASSAAAVVASASVPVRPRQPHNLQGLLRFAMEATQAEDVPSNPNLAPMDEERRRFLEEALKSLTVDVARILQDNIKVLSDSERISTLGSDDMPQEIEAAFNNLLEFIDDIDIANDFYKVGGFAVLPVCLGSPSEAVRARACSLLGELCQNNPYLQERTLETGLLNVLIGMAENEVAPRVLAMTTFALSCATREFEPACKEFVAQHGCDVLLRLLGVDNAQVRTKAAFLTRYFCINWPEAREELLSKGLVGRLGALLSAPRDSSSEHVLGALAALADEPGAPERLRDPDAALRPTLERYLRAPELRGDTDYVEERDYCRQLLAALGDGGEDAPVER